MSTWLRIRVCVSGIANWMFQFLLLVLHDTKPDRQTNVFCNRLTPGRTNADIVEDHIYHEADPDQVCSNLFWFESGFGFPLHSMYCVT